MSSHGTGSSVLSAVTPNRCSPWDDELTFGCQESRRMTSHQDITLEWTCRQNLSVLQPLTEEWPYAEVAGLWFLQCFGGKTCECKLGKPLGFSEWTSLGWGAPRRAVLQHMLQLHPAQGIASIRDKCWGFFSPTLHSYFLIQFSNPFSSVNTL